MVITKQGQQLINTLREWNRTTANYRLVIEINEGVWDVTLTETGTVRRARGTGITFDEAWDGMTPTHFQRCSQPHRPRRATRGRSNDDRRPAAMPAMRQGH